jgi:hypothetical protein
MIPEPIAVTLTVGAIFENLHIPYFVVGSMVTAVHGVARATMDVDLVADLGVEQVAALIEMFEPEFFADSEMIQNAIRDARSFNVIHRETLFKVDVFPHHGRPFDVSQFSRCRSLQLTEDPAETVYVCSPEDNILAKLEGYELDSRVSDRQWRDILNVLAIQGDRLDFGYLTDWALQLSVDKLLEVARSQV